MLFLTRIAAVSSLQGVAFAQCDVTYIKGRGYDFGPLFSPARSCLARTFGRGMTDSDALEEARRDLLAVRLAFRRGRADLVAMQFELDKLDWKLRRGLELVERALRELGSREEVRR